jgi:hypothetical protein
LITRPSQSVIAEEERVLEVDDLPDRFPAGRSDAVDDATHVVDLEGDVPEPRTVRGRRQLVSAGGRRVEAHHLEHVGAVADRWPSIEVKRLARDRGLPES